MITLETHVFILVSKAIQLKKGLFWNLFLDGSW